MGRWGAELIHPTDALNQITFYEQLGSRSVDNIRINLVDDPKQILLYRQLEKQDLPRKTDPALRYNHCTNNPRH